MNIINAIYNLVNNPIVEVVSHYTGNNRANNAGDALEEYVKDLFANSFNMEESERLKKLSEAFSYLGNKNNPPDAMLNGGDAIEVKKIENKDASLALNSSYPKHTLKSISPMISSYCRKAEEWTEKDIIYVVGVVNDNKLNQLMMVYGLDYCASGECYKRIKNTIKEGIHSIPDVVFTDTDELARVNKVDPLGITYLRVRGMWGIDNPLKVFNYVYKINPDKKFNFMCIINDKKWKSFDNTNLLNTLHQEYFLIKNVKIRDPNNPANFVPAKLITYSF